MRVKVHISYLIRLRNILPRESFLHMHHPLGSFAKNGAGEAEAAEESLCCLPRW